MKLNPLLSFLSGAALAVALSWSTPAAPAAPQQQDMPEEMKKMFDQAKKYTEPSEAHKKLADYLGTWDCEWRMTMGGGEPSAVGKCKAEISWLMDGKFTKAELSGTFMGQPFKAFGISGYDNFKKAYVRVMVDGMQTFILTAQGKLAQDGKTMIYYGTMDEYLTGENDKMVKYVMRWKDADHFVEEVHDLAIGEENTKVMEMAFSRAK